MKFSFSLARVLKIKGIWEERSKQRLSVAAARHLQAERLLAVKVDYLNGAWHSLTQLGSKTIGDLHQQLLLVELAAQDVQQQADKVMRTEMALKQARQEFIQARKKRQVLDNLRDRQHADYLVEQRVTENKQLDEIAVMWHRPRGN